MTTEALVPAAAEPAVVTAGGGESVLPQMIAEAGAAAVGRYLEFTSRGGREREDAGGVRAGGGAVSRVVRGARARAARRLAAHVAAYIRTHPGSVPTVKQHLHLAAIRAPHARRQPGPPREPRGRGCGAEARCRQGRAAGPLAG